MPRKPKPHPRSLDALFGPAPSVKAKQKRPPRKPRVKHCPNGHVRAASYKPGSWCNQCYREKEAARQASGAAKDREEWRKKNGPAPATLEIRFKATGRVVRYSIPKHLAPRKARGRRRGRAV